MQIKSFDSFFKKRKMAENCTKSAATFTLPEGEATYSNSSLQLPDDYQMSLKLQVKSVVDVDVDSECLQNR